MNSHDKLLRHDRPFFIGSSILPLEKARVADCKLIYVD